MNGNGRHIANQPSPPLVRRLLLLAWSYRWGCIKLILLHALLLMLTVAGLGLAGEGIDFIRHHALPDSAPPHGFLGIQPPRAWTPMATLSAYAAVIVALALVRAVVTYLSNTAAVRLVQQGIVVDLRAKVYDKLQRLSFRFFDDNASGTLINRVTSDVQSVRLFVDGVVIQTVGLILSVVIYFVYMVRIHVLLTFACLAVLPLIYVASVVFSRLVRAAYTRDRLLVDALILEVSETVRGVHVVKGFSREAEFEQRFSRANHAVRDQKQRIFMLTSLYGPTVEMLTRGSIFILLVYGGYLVTQGELPLGAGLVVFLGLLQRFATQLTTVTTVTDNVQQSLAAARRVFEVLDAPPEVQSAPRAIRRPAIQGNVRFEHVSFEYELGQSVLSDITFDVRQGQCIGVLGTTGCGKSTLLSLIPRFYDVTAGQILIDGLDVRRLSLEDLRRQVGIVFQESFLFSNTVAANIAFGHPHADDAQVQRAARLASAHDFVSGLANGYETVLGEGGADLSGGQRQRLAIARAILTDPAILLLDDPTAAVDAETEVEILDAIDTARQGRTSFLVTHRIQALSRADLILVLHRGRLVQAGTHADLLNRRGPYRRAAQIQRGDEMVE